MRHQCVRELPLKILSTDPWFLRWNFYVIDMSLYFLELCGATVLACYKIKSACDFESQSHFSMQSGLLCFFRWYLWKWFLRPCKKSLIGKVFKKTRLICHFWKINLRDCLHDCLKRGKHLPWSYNCNAVRYTPSPMNDSLWIRCIFKKM